MTAASLLVVFNLFIIESMLSVDNAAVLAVMVRELPVNQRKKALRYGMLGAYVFRGLCLFLAAWLVEIQWLKIIGGLYLLYLTYSHFTTSNDSIEEMSNPNESKIFKWGFLLGLSKFWATVVLVEVMDLAFSIDNVFAAVALSNNFWLIMTGVGIGILAMRFVAGWFVSLIEKHPFLEKSAFIVIAILGLRLMLSGLAEYVEALFPVKVIMSHHVFDFAFSALMMLIFFLPLLFDKYDVSKFLTGLADDFEGGDL